jgi:hypothetical protein
MVMFFLPKGNLALSNHARNGLDALKVLLQGFLDWKKKTTMQGQVHP